MTLQQFVEFGAITFCKLCCLGNVSTGYFEEFG